MQGVGNGTGAVCECQISSWRSGGDCDIHTPAKQRNLTSTDSYSMGGLPIRTGMTEITTLPAPINGGWVTDELPTHTEFLAHLSLFDDTPSDADLLEFNEIRWSDLKTSSSKASASSDSAAVLVTAPYNQPSAPRRYSREKVRRSILC